MNAERGTMNRSSFIVHRSSLLFLFTLWLACSSSRPLVPEHRRMERRDIEGTRSLIEAGLPKPVELFITPQATADGSCDLLIHFHGASWIPFQSAAGSPLCVAAVHLGAGSSVYERPFNEAEAYDRLVIAIEAKAPPVRKRYLTAFSAGYGAVRAILRNHQETIHGVLLLDGLHTGYTAEGDVEAEKMEPFRKFALRAAGGAKRFVITHSEIVPGYYAGTSETADDLLRAVKAVRNPRIQQRFGMIQTYETRCGDLLILGFRGDAAPDHMDHLHSMADFLRLLLDPLRPEA